MWVTMDISASRKPSELDLDHHSPTAAKRWKHWLKIFENYLEDARERMPRPVPYLGCPAPGGKLTFGAPT